jgi:site-specific recombinase XerD
VLTFTRRRHEAVRKLPTPDPFDRRGQYRSPVTFPGYRIGREPANKGQTYPPEVLTPEEVFALMDAAGRGPCGKRNRALIMVGWRAGLRCKEALDLYPKDVDLDRGQIQVLHGKGNKRRIVAIDPGVRAILEQWTRARAQLGLTGRQPLFCVVSEPTRGERLYAAYVRAMMTRLGRKAGIEKRVHYHGLRHSYAAYLMDRGVPIHYIKRMLGHTSIAITERYVDHINPAEVVEVLRALEWPDHAAALQRSQSIVTA